MRFSSLMVETANLLHSMRKLFMAIKSSIRMAGIRV
jgi:hypothetical protein